MSIYGIRSPMTPATHGTGSPGVAPGGHRPGVERPATPARPAPTATPAPAQGASVPAQAPPGTDPELWSVLSAEERAYFAKLGAMGPLTYGRIISGQMQPTAPQARGGRLDVKA